MISAETHSDPRAGSPYLSINLLNEKLRSSNDLVTALTEAGIEFEAVGDCVNVGKIDNAIHNGFLAAAKI